MSRFPHLPETFILREMDAMESLGWVISLYPLMLQKSVICHEEARPWMLRAHSLGFFTAPSFLALLRLAFRNPRVLAHITATICRGYRGNLKSLIKALAIVPKTILAAQKMQEEGIEHIHAHYATYPALAAWIINKLTMIPYSVTVHAHDIFVDRAMLSIKLSDAAFIAAISNFNREFLIHHVGTEISSKLKIVHCGIEPLDYAKALSVTRPYDEIFRILSTGSLQPYKGQIHLIRACALLKERGVPLSCKIIGGGSLHVRLSREIKDWHLEAEVTLLGAKTQNEVALLLAEADCYVQPSIIMPSGKMEGIPVSIMEAFATGIPVVASDISGIPELVRPSETGFLVRPEDPIALADGLETVYRNPTLALQLARQGQTLVKKEFNVVKNARQLGQYILQVS